MSCKANFNIQKPLQELAAAVEKIISEVDFKDEEVIKTPPPAGIRVSKSMDSLSTQSPPVTPDFARNRQLNTTTNEFEGSPFAKKVNDECITISNGIALLL